MDAGERATIAKVCCDVFEQLAFMFGEMIDKAEAECDAETFQRASMSFSGDRSGIIEIIMPSELAGILARNIIGLDESESPDPEGADDALKEVLNTICGRMLTVLFNDQEVFDLTIPSTSVIGVRKWESMLNDIRYVALDIEDHPVLISMSY